MNFALNGISLSASAYMPDRFMFTSKRSFMLHDWYECRHNFNKGHGSVTCIVLKTDICGREVTPTKRICYIPSTAIGAGSHITKH